MNDDSMNPPSSGPLSGDVASSSPVAGGSVPGAIPASGVPGEGSGVSSSPAPRRKRSRRSLARELGVLSAIGVLAATLITVSTNVLVARFYTRWDVTSAGLYTLSPPTLETLHGLSENIDVIVLLSQGDPDFGGLARLLDQYRAEARLLNVRYVDPDRNPAEFIALSNRYRLSEGRAEEGHLVSDAAVVLVRGEGRWVVGAEDIRTLDEEHGVVQPRAEQALTEGLRQVLDPTRIDVCFSTGQGEPSLEDGGPTGLGALAHTLRKNNYGTRELPLLSASSELLLSQCALVVVVAPRDRITPAVAQRLVAAARHGKAMLVSLGPSLDEDNRPTESGLEPLLNAFDVRSKPGLLFERDPDAVLPVGLGGEAFLAKPVAHAITQGLLQGGEPRYRVLMQLAQAVLHDAAAGEVDGSPPEAPAQVSPLLVTSERAFGVLNATRVAEGTADVDSLEHDSQGPFTVALASQLAPAAKDVLPGRLVLLGSPSPLLGAAWQDPTLAGTRRFTESAVSWLVSRPALVSLPDKPGREVELRFTEESLGEVVRYVLLYMPGTALALGGLILYRRRSVSATRVRVAKPEAGRKEGGS